MQPLQPSNYPQGYAPQGNMPPLNRPYTQPGPGQYNQPSQYPPGMAAPPPQRRLDPDQMPNPIQVMTENQRSVTGPFITNEIGGIPPLVTTKFVTHDQGNSGPRFIRSTMYNVPATPDMIKQTSVPFSLIISPFAETAEGEIIPPIVDFGELGPIRCIRCKAYMSPHMQFVDAGRRFRCAMCKATTEGTFFKNQIYKSLFGRRKGAENNDNTLVLLITTLFNKTMSQCIIISINVLHYDSDRMQLHALEMKHFLPKARLHRFQIKCFFAFILILL